MRSAEISTNFELVPAQKLKAISGVLAKTAETYGPTRVSIHAQRMRDIVATKFVRNFPDGVKRAARALFDTEEVILKNYAHTSKGDRSRGVYDGIKGVDGAVQVMKSKKSRDLTDLFQEDPAEELFKEMVKRFGREQLLSMKRDTFEAITLGAKPYIRTRLWELVQQARK